MRTNRLKEIWADGRAALNCWLGLPGPLHAEAVGAQGWDAVTIDQQHGLIGYSDVLAMVQALRASDAVPMVRVPWNAPGDIMKALDAGALGIICPMISTAAECESFVRACRYPPDGFRSYGPTRPAMIYGGDYAENANAEIVTFAMIETAEGLANAAAICAVPGLDGIYIGPSDLSLSLGGEPRQDSDDPKVLAAFDRILAATKAAGIRTGVHTNSAAYSKQMIARGFDLVTVGSDMRYLMGGRREVIEMRKG
ncbi:MAG: 2,4-dihydroxyhept-2-ene-1,7-dioic acid aldolase [Phenylobacterium sp.]|uniref:HpcH/HpaI aldolase family protein n=1 Tax=Phenylobacterium sp. TaxID=1871053 RepID=UPI001A522B73|nr:aldolase/citrate lyase family protein [Phenylobacterium sp.]MBL8554481.1 2,4-dihydroxyhept-2-ene-1,7-dioic acid aldolase [Phenylobacterium sp.]